MKNKNYIPQNTHDVEAVERLKQLPFESVRDDVPVLLQDTLVEVEEKDLLY